MERGNMISDLLTKQKRPANITTATAAATKKRAHASASRDEEVTNYVTSRASTSSSSPSSTNTTLLFATGASMGLVDNKHDEMEDEHGASKRRKLTESNGAHPSSSSSSSSQVLPLTTPPPSVAIVAIAEDIVRCQVCGKECKDEVSKKSHMRTHSRPKSLKCQAQGCEEKFPSKQDRKTHVEQFHPVGQDNPWQCLECAKIFLNGDRLRSHMRSHNKRHKCEKCGMRFRNPAVLKRHQGAPTACIPNRIPSSLPLDMQ